MENIHQEILSLIDQAQNDIDFQADYSEYIIATGDSSADYALYHIDISDDYYVFITFSDSIFNNFSVVYKGHHPFIGSNDDTSPPPLDTMDQIYNFVIDILDKQNDRTLTGFQSFDEFNVLTQGNQTWILQDKQGQNTNIIALANINNDCIMAFDELMADGLIELTPTSFLVAQTEGTVYDIEIAEEVKVYNSPRWLPILVKKGKNFVEE